MVRPIFSHQLGLSVLLGGAWKLIIPMVLQHLDIVKHGTILLGKRWPLGASRMYRLKHQPPFPPFDQSWSKRSYPLIVKANERFAMKHVKHATCLLLFPRGTGGAPAASVSCQHQTQHRHCLGEPRRRDLAAPPLTESHDLRYSSLRRLVTATCSRS